MQFRILLAAMPFRKLRMHAVALSILCTALFVAVTSIRCPEQPCSHASRYVLGRYNTFVRAVTKSGRRGSSRSRTIHHETLSRKRSTYPTYNHAAAFNGRSVPLNHAASFRRNTAYRPRTVLRTFAHEGRAAMLLKQRQNMQAERLRILARIEQSRQKPWWGQWSTWSACGRSCGSGVQFQERHCLGSLLIPTRKKGKLLCEGPTRKYRVCNSAPCPANMPSFRALQCTQHAVSEVRGKYYSWKPYGHPVDEIASNEPCQLVCVSDNDEVQMNTVAMDGTECRRGWNDGRCVEGKCQLIGCDGKINSTKLRNRCGKCDDDETSCAVHDEVFSHSFGSPGEIEVVRIPEGAYDILINERRKTSISIVLKDDNGTVLFNGGGESSSTRGVEGWPANVWIAGAEFRYRRPLHPSNSGGFEYILTVGPIDSPIVVYMNAKNHGSTIIHYEYKTPTRNTRIDITTPTTVVSETMRKDISYGAQMTSLAISASSGTEPVHSIKVAKPPLVTLSPEPPVILSPDLKGHPEGTQGEPEEIVKYEYVDNEDSGYSDEGEGFLLIREIAVDPVDETAEDNITSSDSQPNNGANNKVLSKVNSHLADGNDVILVGGAPEGPNLVLLQEEDQERETIARVYTVERQEPADNETDIDYGDYGDDEDEGDDDIPEDYDIVPGVDIAIPIGTRRRGRYGYRRYIGYRWRTNGFAPCSSTCTSGLQDSYTVCERARDDITVDDSYCNPTTRPEPVRKFCANQTCEPRWEATPWSECSLSCGTGVRMRTVRCWMMIGPGFDSTMYNEVCRDVAGEKPIETKPCQIVDRCGPLWETSDWLACRAPCGRRGVKWRTVRCSAGLDHMCASTPRPLMNKACFGPPCMFNWISTDWSPCSGVCGGGRKTRRVVCADRMGREHPEDRCDIGTKPATSHPCGDENCRPEWIAQDWEECSAECGEGNRTRTVLCSGIVNGEVHQYEDDTTCSGAPKPPTQEPCRLRECEPVWFNTSWSKCSVTCGKGQRVREVKCYQGSAIATGCDVTQKPPNREECKMPPCPVPRPAQCRNKPTVNCGLVIRVGLCSHWYYKKACCSSCQFQRQRGK